MDSLFSETLTSLRPFLTFGIGLVAGLILTKMNTFLKPRSASVDEDFSAQQRQFVEMMSEIKKMEKSGGM